MITLRRMISGDLPLFKRWLTAPHVARWFHHPLDWIDEVENQDGEFSWIRHYIAEYGGEPVGFCQYYACAGSGEEWAIPSGVFGAYSIDYLIGEVDYLGRGFGKLIVAALAEKIAAQPDARLIAVQPEPENAASRGLLSSCGFEHDEANDIYVLPLRK